MIENALIALSSNKKESNLDQTNETETPRDKLQSKMHHKDQYIKKDSDDFKLNDNYNDNEYENEN